MKHELCQRTGSQGAEYRRGARRFGALRRVRLALRRKHRLTVTNRYEAGMMISELFTGMLFVAGSICLFYPHTKPIPQVLYLLGSIAMLLRSGIRGSYWFRLKAIDRSEKEDAEDGVDWSR